jgi:dihydrofolate reductase
MKGNIEEEIKKMKRLPGKNLTLFGSKSLLTQFAQQGLVDEYQIMVNPIVLGDGTPIFKGIIHRLNLKLKTTRSFKSGNVLLYYQPMDKA